MICQQIIVMVLENSLKNLKVFKHCKSNSTARLRAFYGNKLLAPQIRLFQSGRSLEASTQGEVLLLLFPLKW
jgi:hypothetical protein